MSNHPAQSGKLGAAGYFLVCQVGDFGVKDTPDIGALGVDAFPIFISTMAVRVFRARAFMRQPSLLNAHFR